MRLIALAAFSLLLAALAVAQPPDASGPINVSPKPLASDKAVKIDYDIVYVRAPRNGDKVGTNWPEISNPVFMDAGADLALVEGEGENDHALGEDAGAQCDRGARILHRESGRVP